MIGTIVNTATIIVGSIAGAMLKKGIKPRYQRALFDAMGLCSICLGVNAFCQNMPNSQYPVLFIVSIALGSVIGYACDLDGRFKRLVDRKEERGARSEERESERGARSEERGVGRGEVRLSDGLIMAILLYCVGTFSMIGPVLSAINGDNTYLFTNATLDLVTSAVLATTFGIGVIWAAPVLFCWQGMFYLIATLSATLITDEIRTELCIVGGLLITASGLSLLKLKAIPVINLLPAFLVALLALAVLG